MSAMFYVCQRQWWGLEFEWQVYWLYSFHADIHESSVVFKHRIITARKEKGWRRHFFHQIETNWPLPYSTMACMPVPRLREARPAGLVTYWLLQHMHKYNAKSPKQDRKRFNSIVKTIHIFYLPIIYLCLQVSGSGLNFQFVGRYQRLEEVMAKRISTLKLASKLYVRKKITSTEEQGSSPGVHIKWRPFYKAFFG